MVSFKLIATFFILYHVIKTVNTFGVWVQPPPEEPSNITTTFSPFEKDGNSKDTANTQEKVSNNDEIPMWLRVLAIGKSILDGDNKKKNTETKPHSSSGNDFSTPKKKPLTPNHISGDTSNKDGHIFSHQPFLTTIKENVQTEKPLLQHDPSIGISKTEDQILPSFERSSTQKPSVDTLGIEEIGKTKEVETVTVISEQPNDDVIDAGTTVEATVNKGTCGKCIQERQCQLGNMCTYILIFSSTVYFYRTLDGF